MPKGSEVSRMFAGIAGRYDLANHVLSGGLDFYWRWRIVQAARKSKPGKIVDLATGSGDVAFALNRRLGYKAKIEGLDFCDAMLQEAKRKRESMPGTSEISFRTGDCLNLPLPDESVDLVTIAFGLRNLEDRALGLHEMHRVLKKPGGRLIVLEFTQPHRFLKPFYYLYLKYILPHLAGFVTGRKDAYHYLAGSIESFPTRQMISEEIRSAGFKHVQATGLNLSIVALHVASTASPSFQ